MKLRNAFCWSNIASCGVIVVQFQSAEHTKMMRKSVAFVVAPLWVPLAVAVFAATVVFPNPAQIHWVIISTVIGSILTYAGVLLVGLPIYPILVRRGWTSIWVAIALGFVVGALVNRLFMVLFALSLGSGVAYALKGVAEVSVVDVSWLGITGLLGVLIGMTLWLIARPDREDDREQHG
jgi:hypothetical protein